MAEKDGFDKPPYTNLLTYKKYKEQGAQILNIPEQILRTEADTSEGEISEEDEE
jgi:glutathione peroxidase-family protein